MIGNIFVIGFLVVALASGAFIIIKAIRENKKK
jgi:hypothetical protein